MPIMLRIPILGGQVRGKGTYPPEVEIFMDAFDVAIADVICEASEYYEAENRAESKRWLGSEHAFWVGSLLYGLDTMRAFQNWVRDGMPPPEEARKRKFEYYTERELECF